MKNSSGAIIHLVKLINAAYPVITQHKCTPVEEQFAEQEGKKDLFIVVVSLSSFSLLAKMQRNTQALIQSALTSATPAALSLGLW